MHRRAGKLCIKLCNIFDTVLEQNQARILTMLTRRDYHDFFTMPIIRQALTVFVPEYDEVTPVLAKPVRHGPHALAQGSRLQGFALTVGICRIVEDPVACAINVLLASDVNGQVRGREALATWPLSLSRRISARHRQLDTGQPPSPGALHDMPHSLGLTKHVYRR